MKYPRALSTVHPIGRPILPQDIEEALEVGRACRDLVESPAYKAAMDGLQAYHTEAMVMTPEGPQGTAVREHHHRMIFALHELRAEVEGRAEKAAEIERALADAAGDNEEFDE